MTSKGKPTNRAAAHLPALVEPRLAKALTHVLRQHVLLAAVQGEVSPSELSKALDVGVSQVSYHVKVLRDDCDGMIVETRSEPRRGVLEHYYRASAKTLLPAKAWRRAKKGLRAAVGAGMASDLFNDLIRALEAGKLQEAHDYTLRTPLVLDEQGRRNVGAIAERASREVEGEQKEAAKRMSGPDGSGGEASAYTFALFAFETASDPADLHAVQEGAGDAAVAPPKRAKRAGHQGGGRKKGGRKSRA